MLKALYDTFLRERRYLKNCSPKALRSHGQAWKAFESVVLPLENFGSGQYGWLKAQERALV